MLEVVKKIVSVTVALGDNAAKMSFLFFQRLTFTMVSFCASCQRHEISINPHETNGVSAVWGLRKNIFDFFIRLYKMLVGEQQKTMVRNTL